MQRLSLWPAVLGLALAMILVNILEPTLHALAYASAGVVLIALLGWIVEAREVAGPAPAVEPEHEEEEEAPGPSYWPLILAVGIVGIAAGLVYEDIQIFSLKVFSSEYGGLYAAVPLALGAAAAWGKRIEAEINAPPIFVMTDEGEAVEAIVGAGGQVFVPVPQRLLAEQAAAGAALAIEKVEAKEVSRRGILRLTFWTGFLGSLGALAGVMIDNLYPRGITGFGSVIIAGTVDQFPPGTKTSVQSGKFWLVNLTEEQGGPGLLALWWKCPHLGCTVPWRDNFTFPDPATGAEKRGWFRCPCHGSTYTDAGVRVFGPAPRSLDRFPITIDPSTKVISVDTGASQKGTPDNSSFAVRDEG